MDSIGADTITALLVLLLLKTQKDKKRGEMKSVACSERTSSREHMTCQYVLHNISIYSSSMKAVELKPLLYLKIVGIQCLFQFSLNPLSENRPHLSDFCSLWNKAVVPLVNLATPFQGNFP